MSTAPTAEPPNLPSPHPDRPTGADKAAQTLRLLTLVRALIDYGKQLAHTLQNRGQTTNLSHITRSFGSIDIALILSHITRGLHRAAELEARLAARLARKPAAQAAISAPSRRQKRATPDASTPDASTLGVDPGASPTASNIARLPTPAAIAAQVRRRPVGAVLADICRDLGIEATHPLWRELFIAIIEGGGNLGRLMGDIGDRIIDGLIQAEAAQAPAAPPPGRPSSIMPHAATHAVPHAGPRPGPHAGPQTKPRTGPH